MDVIVVPTVEALGQVKIGITSEEDVQEAGAPTQRDGLVEDLFGAFGRWAIPASIDDEQRLLCVCQRHEQWVISPDALV